MSSKITTEFLQERFKITPEKIDKAVKILIKLYNPLKIYVFGSYVQGTHDHGSYVDFLFLILYKT
ncbi:nucleotidyltransferase domain-containing protein [Candidatus Babeliales bacterium]|nr:nucleotidyltransferase domain-containing protein [Candidatus Babeliales bacterium]